MTDENQKTILLVEDEALIAMMETNTLEEYGYTVITTNTGEKAIEIVETTPDIDLILIDIDLGKGIDGTEAAVCILKNHDLPILFLSSHTEREIVEKTEGITSYGYVVKNTGDIVLIASIKMAFKLFDSRKKEKEKEKALREQEDHAFGMIQAIPDLMFRINRKGVLLDHKADISNRYAQSIPKIIGRKNHDIAPPEFWYLIERHIHNTLETGLIQTFEYSLPIPGKGVCDYEARMVPSGEDEVTAIVRDVTDRKQAYESLKKSEERFQEVLNNSCDASYKRDLRTSTYDYLSPVFANITGYTPDEMKAKPIEEVIDLMHPDDMHEVKRVIAESLSGSPGTAYTTEYRFKHKDGQHRWLHDQFVVVQDADGQPAALIGSVSDITKRKQTEDTLRESELKYRSFIEHSTDVVFCVNQKGEYQFTNNVFASTFGKTSDYFIGKTFWDIYPNEHADQRQAANIRLFETGETQSLEVEVPLPDKTLYFLVKANPIKNDNGKVILDLVIATDITDRKIAEEKVKSLLAEKELLLRDVHHRIKNNTNTMISMLSLQSENQKDPAAIEALQDAKRRMYSMSILYDKLYSSIDLKELQVRDYISTLVDEIVVMFPNNSIVKVEKHIDEFILDVQAVQPLGRIFNELLTNIMKYAFIGRDNGKISITASKIEDKVFISIQDNGVGIPKSVDFENTAGLGLMLVKMLVKQLDGTIDIERKDGTKINIEFTM